MSRLNTLPGSPANCDTALLKSERGSPRSSAVHRLWNKASRAILATLCSAAAVMAADAEPSTPSDQLDEIHVTAERLGLLGRVSSASEGVIVNDELALNPAFRVGQLLEARRQQTSLPSSPRYRAPGAPEKSVRRTTRNQSHAICGISKVSFDATPPLNVKQIDPVHRR
jgi:hypothetical protein